MTDTTWDEKYARDCDPEKTPSLFLTQQISRLSRGKALDLASTIDKRLKGTLSSKGTI